MSAKFVAPEARRWIVVALKGRKIDQRDQPQWLIGEVILSDDMNADRPKLMQMKVGDTILDHDGDLFERVV